MGKIVLSAQTELVLTQARTEAVQLGHGQVETVHLLLGVLEQRGTKAHFILQHHGWSAEAVRRLLERGTPNLPLPAGLTKTAKDALIRAREEARQLSSAVVTPEHLLLALLRLRHGSAAKTLQENGTDAQWVFSDLCFLLKNETMPCVERSGNMRLLEQFCDDMVARAGTADPVIGRNREIETVIGILIRKNKNNPALIGEPGVGKTAIAEGLAQRMAAGKVPQALQGKRLLSLNMANVLAGTKYRGEFEERVRDILAEIKRCGNVILFVDEMHTLVGAGSAEGAIDAANLLKPALGRGEIQMMGATTLEEYRKHIEKDAALERRFRPVVVEEPSKEETLTMLEGLRFGLERHHGLRITAEAMSAAVELSCRYLCERFLPDKAVDLLDEAAAKVGSRRKQTGNEAKRKQLQKQLSDAVEENRFEQAAQLRDRLQQLNNAGQQTATQQVLEAEDVALVVSQRTGIPVGRVTDTDQRRLRGLEEELRESVYGQEEAVKTVTAAVCRGRMGMADEARPVASMLFTGPTGVGKTALCKALAQCVFGSETSMIRLDMSEYMEKHSVSRLIGAPPGYVGHEQGGELTEKVRRRPYCVILLDEVEKAHRDIQGLLLQVMEDGILTDSMGRQVNFRNAVVVMTSNLGSGRTELEQVGFVGSGRQAGTEKALKEFFTPEFLGRLDCIVPFAPLTEDSLRKIAERELGKTKERAKKAGASLQTDECTAAFLAGRCLRQPGGAREVRRLIRTMIEAPVAEKLLTGNKDLHLYTAVEQETLQVLER